MRQAAIGFESKKLILEGILTTPNELPGPHPAILLCHPHPMLSGNMDHPVLTAISNAADKQGFATLRFNFRGVGESEGSFSNGEGEQDDAKAALNVLKHWPGLDNKRLLVAGYSFGASVILSGFKHHKAAKAFALIAPPVSSLQSSRIKKDKRPKLFIAGQNDKVAPSLDLQRTLDEVHQPVKFVEIAEADHTLRSHEAEAAEKVVEFAVEALRS